jgi:cob(I)alamin adenosyltransferase
MHDETIKQLNLKLADDSFIKTNAANNTPEDKKSNYFNILQNQEIRLSTFQEDTSPDRRLNIRNQSISKASNVVLDIFDRLDIEPDNLDSDNNEKARNEERIRELLDQLKDKDDDIDEIRADFKEEKVKMEEKYVTIITEKDNKIVSLQSKLDSKNAFVEDLNQSIEKFKGAVKEDNTNDLHQVNKKVLFLEQVIGKYERDIEELKTIYSSTNEEQITQINQYRSLVKKCNQYYESSIKASELTINSQISQVNR